MRPKRRWLKASTLTPSSIGTHSIPLQFSPHPASRFVELNPEVALREYLDAGYVDDEAEAWVAAGIPAYMAEAWRWYGFKVDVAAPLTAADVVDPAWARSIMLSRRHREVILWPQFGVTWSGDIAAADCLVQMGLSPGQAVAWLDARTSLWRDQPEERHLLTYLDDNAESVRWISAGITDPSEPLDWKRVGIEADAVALWISAQVGPEAAIPWRQARIEDQLAIQWIRAGVLHPDTAPQMWRGTTEPPMPADVTAACVRAGLTPDDAMTIDAADPSTLSGLRMLAALQES